MGYKMKNLEVNIHIINVSTENIFLDEKSYEKALIYGIVYKTSNGAKPISIIFDKMPEKYEKIFDKIRYLVLLKNKYFRKLFS